MRKKKDKLSAFDQRTHEIRDPVHNFIKLESPERLILNCPAFQRLRDVHQLAMTYLVYPGATHTRFEHSLGVMELATRIYDTVTASENIRQDSVKRVGQNRVRSIISIGAVFFGWLLCATTLATSLSRTLRKRSCYLKVRGMKT